MQKLKKTRRKHKQQKNKKKKHLKKQQTNIKHNSKKNITNQKYTISSPRTSAKGINNITNKTTQRKTEKTTEKQHKTPSQTLRDIHFSRRFVGWKSCMSVVCLCFSSSFHVCFMFLSVVFYVFA